jgi:hypothetical protein
MPTGWTRYLNEDTLERQPIRLSLKMKSQRRQFLLLENADETTSSAGSLAKAQSLRRSSYWMLLLQTALGAERQSMKGLLRNPT